MCSSDFKVPLNLAYHRANIRRLRPVPISSSSSFFSFFVSFFFFVGALSPLTRLLALAKGYCGISEQLRCLAERTSLRRALYMRLLSCLFLFFSQLNEQTSAANLFSFFHSARSVTSLSTSVLRQNGFGSFSCAREEGRALIFNRESLSPRGTSLPSLLLEKSRL